MHPADPFGMAGQVLDGQFRIDHFVGEGGFSIVYKGTHVGLSEPIAIKCLKLPTALGSALVESFVKRFRDESRLHYKLSQGNLHIVRSIASGTTFAPTTSALVPYTVLEWLEGRSLAEEFTDRRSRGLHGRSLAEVVKLLDSAVDAVAFAHAQGVVHRDLNPGNLFLARTASGTKLKVLDFGVAKILADSTLAMGPSTRTLGNVRMFAPAYGAPEQFDERVGAVGPWTDVYALSLVLLEALTDRTVMEGEHLGEFAMKALDANRPTPRALGVAVGNEVEKLLSRALAVTPDERPRDAGELWGMLKHAIRADEFSGVAPHAHHVRAPEADVPATVRMPERMTTGQSPVVEVVRPASSPPVSPAIPGARSSLPGGTPSSGLTSTLRADQLSSAMRGGHASTLRMSRTPRSGAEALAATPGPAPVHTPAPPAATSGAPMHAMTPPPPAAPVLGPIPPLSPLPQFSKPPPSAIFLRSGQPPPAESRGRTPWALLVLLFLAVFGLLALGVWLIGYGGHR
ncbi:MAG TPA: protein kinase [Polyangiaceae bacterium]